MNIDYEHCGTSTKSTFFHECSGKCRAFLMLISRLITVSAPAFTSFSHHQIYCLTCREACIIKSSLEEQVHYSTEAVGGSDSSLSDFCFWLPFQIIFFAQLKEVNKHIKNTQKYFCNFILPNHPFLCFGFFANSTQLFSLTCRIVKIILSSKWNISKDVEMSFITTKSV